MSASQINQFNEEEIKVNTEKKKTGKVKKIVLGVVVLFVLFIIICCMAGGGDDSEETVENVNSAGSAEEVKELVKGYCGAIKGYDLDNTGKYLASEADYWVNMNENVLNTFRGIFKDGVSNLEYTIEDIEVDEGQEVFSWANVSVRFRFLDYSEVMSASLERIENEYEASAISSDMADEEIYNRLYEIFVEEQKSADDAWNEILIDFTLAKNRNKPNPAWYIDSIPEDISTILSCNTESSFEKYGTIEKTQNKAEGSGSQSQTQEASDARHQIGESVAFVTDNGGEISVIFTDWGSKFDGIDKTVLFVSYTIENVGKESVSVGPGLFDVYADDYSIAKTSVLGGTDDSHYVDLSAGRKTDGTFYADINPENADVIEVECGGSVFVLKDVSMVGSSATALDENNLGDVSIPSDIKVDDSSIEPDMLSGSYGGMMGQSTLSLSIYSSQEEGETGIGNAEIYVEGGQYSYHGQIAGVAINVYEVAADAGEEVLLAASTSDDGTIMLQLYVNGQLIEEYCMLEHYES